MGKFTITDDSLDNQLSFYALIILLCFAGNEAPDVVILYNQKYNMSKDF
jgi:hypothetical protein